jgi:electron transport complex protein RnfC
MRKLFRFRGGVHLEDHKELSNQGMITDLPLPEKIILPMRQHIGAPAEPVVQVGERVLKGQLIASSKHFVSAPVHASTSGTVIAIGPHALPHSSHIAETCIVIEPDGRDQWSEEVQAWFKPECLSEKVLRERIGQAGIVGLGGAVFPSSVKLKPTRTIDTLVINGAECEPFITCDDALMRTRADAILRGTLLLQRLLHTQQCIVAIEDNKQAAIASLQTTRDKFIAGGLPDADSIDIVAIPTLFPAGGEKQLIKVVSGREVPAGGLPYEVGIVCLNVGTTAAVYDAIYDGKPLISRVLTVTGPKVKRPGNYRVLLGTPMRHVLQAAGVEDLEGRELIMGGPMMGQRLYNPDVPVVKASNCLLVNEARQDAIPAMPCIRCGACAQACPMQLLPQQLYWHGRASNLDKLEHYHLKDCIECGCCAVVCPSHIPLVHYFRFAKSAIAERHLNRDMANQSRIRNEARQARLDRLKAEQEAKKAARKAARKRKQPGRDESAQAPVEPRQAVSS